MNMNKKVIIDSDMSFENAIKGTDAPKEVIGNLDLVGIQYIGFDDKIHKGQLVLHKDLAEEAKSIFNELFNIRFPIQKVIPIVQYDWSDHDSIRDNNTSAFNYRTLFDADKLSNHSYGRAIDINPRINPCITKEGKVRPTGPSYNPQAKGAISDGDEVVSVFLEAGWEWGGHWKQEEDIVDYQHFQKLLKR